jgi:hypothetical protein
MEKNSTLVQNSRYVAGGATEVNQTALEWWERTVFTLDASDTTYVVDSKFAGRLDLIAKALLGDSSMWWLIAQYNMLLDPFEEVVIGRVLRIPTAARAKTMLKGKVGGYDSTREVPLTNITPIV